MNYAKHHLKLPAVSGLFLSDRNGDRNTAAGVLRTLIYHLLELDRLLLPILDELKESPVTDLRSIKFLETNLELLLSSMETKTTYIFLDGIDELDDKERKHLMGIFLRLPEAANVRLLISSRATADLKSKLSELPQIITNERNEQDIYTYVENEKDDLAELFLIDIREAENILHPIVKRSEGNTISLGSGFPYEPC
jgi:Cdc6-like AAA superfamily ATPase